MKRQGVYRLGTIKQFDNGNMNIKFDLEMLYKDESDIVQLLWLLDSFDTYNISDEYCLSNFDMGMTLYDCYSDLIFIVSFTELAESFKTGKTLKLYARIPDKYDRELIDQFYSE